MADGKTATRNYGFLFRQFRQFYHNLRLAYDMHTYVAFPLNLSLALHVQFSFPKVTCPTFLSPCYLVPLHIGVLLSIKLLLCSDTVSLSCCLAVSTYSHQRHHLVQVLSLIHYLGVRTTVHIQVLQSHN
jgi:hypothetical protein